MKPITKLLLILGRDDNRDIVSGNIEIFADEMNKLVTHIPL